MLMQTHYRTVDKVHGIRVTSGSMESSACWSLTNEAQRVLHGTSARGYTWMLGVGNLSEAVVREG